MEICFVAFIKFKYPQDLGKICPWLLDSVNGVTLIIDFGIMQAMLCVPKIFDVGRRESI